jgi:hypothetical protein
MHEFGRDSEQLHCRHLSNGNFVQLRIAHDPGVAVDLKPYSATITTA